MPASCLHMTLVTLGVRDVARATAFYEGMGLTKAGFDSADVTFFDMGGTALGLYARDALAEDAGIGADGHGARSEATNTIGSSGRVARA